jgi:hypothetical protein
VCLVSKGLFCRSEKAAEVPVSDRVSDSGLVTVRTFLDRLLYSITETLATLASG